MSASEMSTRAMSLREEEGAGRARVSAGQHAGEDGRHGFDASAAVHAVAKGKAARGREIPTDSRLKRRGTRRTHRWTRSSPCACAVLAEARPGEGRPDHS